MTVDNSISKYEQELLRDMIGREFAAFKCDPFVYSPMVFGLIGIYVGEKVYKLTANLNTVRRFTADDDVVRFELMTSADENIKSRMEDGKLIKTPIQSRIKSISIVNDHQILRYNNQSDEFITTVGIIFHLEDNREVSFELETWFSEMITVKRGYDLIDLFAPVSEFLEEWEGCDGYMPDCIREIIILDRL